MKETFEVTPFTLAQRSFVWATVELLLGLLHFVGKALFICLHHDGCGGSLFPYFGAGVMLHAVIC